MYIIKRSLVCVFISAALLLLSSCGPAPVVEFRPSAAPAESVERSAPAAKEIYVLNSASLIFHRPDCAWAAKIAPERRIDWEGDRETLLSVGYDPCKFCKP